MTEERKLPAQYWREFASTTCWKQLTEKAEAMIKAEEEKFWKIEDKEQAEQLRRNIRYAKNMLGRLRNWVTINTR